MSKQIRINAFTMFAPSHLSPGLWRHAQDRSIDYNRLTYWTELAKTLERGLFDGIFLADGLGHYDIYRGSGETALRLGVQFPRLDPVLLVSAMAQVTKHLGFGITSSVSYEPPYLFARRMTSLDHITNGRVGWNIVTSFGDSGSKALHGEAARDHDDRYALADEYLDLVYKYWEASWEDDAVVRDRASGVFADPAKIHAVQHAGHHFRSEGIYICEPSPQRTPLLYQAGASARGRQFAATHAECVLVSGPSKKVVADLVADVRNRAADKGRNPAEILFFTSFCVVTGRSGEEARAKYADYLAHTDPEASAALISGWTGIDFSKLALDDPVSHVPTRHMQSAVERYTTADPGKVWTVGEVLRRIGVGGGGGLAVGSASEVADEMQSWLEDTGIDGFNLGYALSPQSYLDFVEFVVPELQRRGAYKAEYGDGTLREKFFGPGRARLVEPHPAAVARTRRVKAATDA